MTGVRGNPMRELKSETDMDSMNLNEVAAMRPDVCDYRRLLFAPGDPRAVYGLGLVGYSSPASLFAMTKEALSNR